MDGPTNQPTWQGVVTCPRQKTGVEDKWMVHSLSLQFSETICPIAHEATVY